MSPEVALLEDDAGDSHMAAVVLLVAVVVLTFAAAVCASGNG